jgi:hypothetical protein
MFEQLKPAALADNAMLYKDLTQWLRNKTFLGLFFGLLLLAEGVSIFFSSTSLEVGKAGPIVFNTLFLVLFWYGLVIAFLGYSLTAREFQNHTFELYELAGMSLERMVRGKFHSMIAQFLFGFFCIVPFFFFSYLLGGVDFYSIFGMLLLTAFGVPPLYLLALTVALHGQKTKVFATFLRFGAGGGLIWLGWFILTMMKDPGGRGGLFFSMKVIVNQLVAGGGSSLFFLGVFVFFYLMGCLFLFYLNCNAVSPVTDSREGAVKFYASILCLGFMIWEVSMCYSSASVGPLGGLFGVLPALLMLPIECLLGLLYFWGPMEFPLMARRRQEQLRWRPIRFLSYWFIVGPAGTFRTLLLLWGAATVFLIWANTGHSHSAFPYRDSISALVFILLAVPFWVAFPGGVLLRFKRFRYNPTLLRVTLFFWWLSAGLVCLFAGSRGYVEALLTPLSAFSILLHSDAMMMGVVWFVAGAIGLVLMARTLYRRSRLEEADRQAALDTARAELEGLPESTLPGNGTSPLTPEMEEAQ